MSDVLESEPVRLAECEKSVRAGSSTDRALQPSRLLNQLLPPSRLFWTIAVCHALLFVEDAMRQSDAFPADLEPSIRKLVGLDVFSDQPSRQRRLVQNNPRVVVRQGELLSDITDASTSARRSSLSLISTQPMP
ncbi:hypothetical protein GGC47_005355 [Bosea sp. OAE752]|jgi:hypothetical protein